MRVEGINVADDGQQRRRKEGHLVRQAGVGSAVQQQLQHLRVALQRGQLERGGAVLQRAGVEHTSTLGRE